MLDESVCEYCLYSLACTQATPSLSLLHAGINAKSTSILLSLLTLHTPFCRDREAKETDRLTEINHQVAEVYKSVSPWPVVIASKLFFHAQLVANR